MKKLLISLALVLVLVVGFIIPVSADTSDDVTVTATPEFIAITSAPTTWTINDLTGSGVILVDTVYYANPGGDTTPPSATVVDGECNFTITNTSTVATDITCTWGSFTGGDGDMTNSDLGTNGATTYGAYSWFSGDTYASKVIIKSTGSDVGKNALGATTNIKWGCEIETRTNAWTGGSSSTSTLTVTATADQRK